MDSGQFAYHADAWSDLYTYLRPQPALYSEAQPGNLRPGANARAVGFAWWRGVVPKPRWPAAHIADRPARPMPPDAGNVQPPLGGGGGDDGEAPDRAPRGPSGARRPSDDGKTRQSPDPTRA